MSRSDRVERHTQHSMKTVLIERTSDATEKCPLQIFPSPPPSFHSAATTLLCRRLRLYLISLQANGCRMLRLCLLSVRRVWSLFLQPLASFVRVLAMLFFSLTPRLGMSSSMLQSQRLLFYRGLISCCCAACCLELPVVRPFWWVCRCCVRPLP